MTAAPLLSYALMSLKVRLAYRADFALLQLAHAIVAATGLVVLFTIYHHVPEVRGYTRGEALIVWGFADTCRGIFWTLFGGIFHANRRYLVGGELDRLLLRPLDPYARLLLDHLRPENLFAVAAGFAVIAAGIYDSGLSWPVWRLALIPLFALAGAVLLAGLLTAIASVGFWMHHRGSAVGLVSEVGGYAFYPLDFLPSPLAALLLSVLPFAFTGFVPATVYMERPEWWPLAAVQPLVALAFAVGGYAFWRLSLRRYDSSGS